MNWTMPYPWRSRSDSVRRINMSSEPGNESFFCALRPIPRILSLPRQIPGVKETHAPTLLLANSALHLPALDLLQVSIGCEGGAMHRKIVHVEQHECRDSGGLLRLDVLKRNCLHGVQHEGRAAVLLHESHLHIVQLDSPGVAD